jgi:hypothetical protein
MTTASTAQLSSDGLYRYTLGRRWSSIEATSVFVMLNPSTADATQDDPTIRRCISFAQALGCGALHVVNLYAYRATRPADLWQATDPVGPENDTALDEAGLAAAKAGWPLIAAWGAGGKPDRVNQVLTLSGFDRVTALGVTKTGAPRHPLYLPGTARPERWTPIEGPAG